ncbi:MAG: HD domain-containing protein [Bacteroidaceae bacterium]|nr:HD domain-containing protein [Bacteroidaceae bacterium]
MKLLTHEDILQHIDHPFFRLISDTAEELGLECYVIGGWVRDLYLERPSNDIDIVVVDQKKQVERPGIAIAEALKKKIGKKVHIAIYKNFGTAQLKHKQLEIEFVGARKESYDRNSRKPVTEDGTLEEDQNRRDFTINAMALCLNKERFGELVDPFDGLADLEDKIIATPLDPDITFSDDPLRMMRCIRFATQLDFHIEEETFEALGRNRERIKIISEERVADELNKIILSPIPSKGFVELERCGLLPLIFPELAQLQGVETKNGKAHKDNFYHTLEVLDNVAKATTNPGDLPEGNGKWDSPKDHALWLRWAAILHDIGKPKSKRFDPLLGWTFHNHNDIGERMIPAIFRRMKLPMNEKMKFVQKLVQLHMRPSVIADEEVTDSAVRRLLFEAGDDIDDLMILSTADITSKNEVKKKKFIDNFIAVRTKLVEIEEKDRIRNFQPPVSGEEIMEMFGLKPSKEVGMLKTVIKDAILDGKIPNEYEPAKALLIEEGKKMGLTTITNL